MFEAFARYEIYHEYITIKNIFHLKIIGDSPIKRKMKILNLFHLILFILIKKNVKKGILDKKALETPLKIID